MKDAVVSEYIKKLAQPALNRGWANLIYDDLLSLLKVFYQNQNTHTWSFLFTSDISYLDEMWHLMVLNTPAYHKLCEAAFGGYLHHTPEWSLTDEDKTTETQEHVAKQIDVLVKKLGPEFVFRIYELYPKVINGRL